MCKMRTFKDMNVPLHVQSHKLVPVSGIHCPMHTTSAIGFASVHFTVLCRVSSTVSLFQAQGVWKQSLKAAVM